MKAAAEARWQTALDRVQALCLLGGSIYASTASLSAVTAWSFRADQVPALLVIGGYYWLCAVAGWRLFQRRDARARWFAFAAAVPQIPRVEARAFEWIVYTGIDSALQLGGETLSFAFRVGAAVRIGPAGEMTLSPRGGGVNLVPLLWLVMVAVSGRSSLRSQTSP